MKSSLFILLLSLSLNISCKDQPTTPKVVHAKAKITAQNESLIKGVIQFTQQQDEVEILLLLTHLAPNTVHGIHIHEKGNCDNNAKAAGGHFNPYGHQHGGLNDKESHVGDLGNVTSNAKGEVNHKILTKKISLLSNSINSVINRAFVIHGKSDNLKSQPSGNAGKRIGCGVVKK